MALLKCDSLDTVLLCILFHLAGFVANADQCRVSCGYIAPYTAPLANRTCITTGFENVYTRRIDWDDGSYSNITFNFVELLVIGSCCSNFRSSDYGTGIVNNGRFFGKKLIAIYNFRDERQTCIGCQSSAGLSRITGNALLSIGTKGVGDWIECRGKVTLTYSRPLSSTQQSVQSTIFAEFTDCNNCLDSC